MCVSCPGWHATLLFMLIPRFRCFISVFIHVYIGEHYSNILEVDGIRSNMMSVRTLITITSAKMIQVTPPEVRP